MRIVKIAGKKIMIELIVDPVTKEKKVHVIDGQNLGKKCNQIVDAIMKEEGEITHNHQDWDKVQKPIEEETQVQEQPQYIQY